MNVYQIVTQRILESLDKGRIPWVRPWDSTLPFNAVTKKAYRGINSMLLWGGPAYMTINQANKLGGKVKKGTKAEIVTFYKIFDKINKDTGEPDGRTFVLRYYNVFQVQDIEGLPEKYYKLNERAERTIDVHDEAESIVARLNPTIRVEGQKAAYAPILDIIYMPERNMFHSMEEYYSTLFHEIVHWTGHHSRLKRDLSQMKELYAAEELIAEIGTACICASIGLDYGKTIANSAAYCAGWAKALRADKANVITSCASKAHKAADYVLGEVTEEVADATV
jgi:antirestriction protein ArdC